MRGLFISLCSIVLLTSCSFSASKDDSNVFQMDLNCNNINFNENQTIITSTNKKEEMNDHGVSYFYCNNVSLHHNEQSSTTICIKPGGFIESENSFSLKSIIVNTPNVSSNGSCELVYCSKYNFYDTKITALTSNVNEIDFQDKYLYFFKLSNTSKSDCFITSITLNYYASCTGLSDFKYYKFASNGDGGVSLIGFNDSNDIFLDNLNYYVPPIVEGKKTNRVDLDRAKCRYIPPLLHFPKTIEYVADSSYHMISFPKPISIYFDEFCHLLYVGLNSFNNTQILQVVFPYEIEYIHPQFGNNNTLFYFMGKNTQRLPYNNNYFFDCKGDEFLLKNDVLYRREGNRCSVYNINDVENIVIESVVTINGTNCPVYKIECFFRRDYYAPNLNIKTLKLPRYLEEISRNAYYHDLPEHLFTKYKGGLYLGTSDNPYYCLWNYVSDSTEEFVVNDATQLLSYRLADYKNAIEKDGALYVKSDLNSYFLCVGVTKDNAYISNNCEIVCLLDSYARQDVHLPKNLRYLLIESYVVTSDNYSFIFSYENLNYQVMNNCVYRTSSVNGNSLIYCSNSKFGSNDIIPIANGTQYINEGSIFYSGYKPTRSFLLPDSLIYISDNTFDEYGSFDNTLKDDYCVNIPANLKYLGNLFENYTYKARNVLISPDNQFFRKTDNSVVSFDGKELFLSENEEYLQNYQVPNYISIVHKNAIYAHNIFFEEAIDTIEPQGYSNYFATFPNTEKIILFKDGGYDGYRSPVFYSNEYTFVDDFIYVHSGDDTFLRGQLSHNYGSMRKQVQIGGQVLDVTSILTPFYNPLILDKDVLTVIPNGYKFIQRVEMKGNSRLWVPSTVSDLSYNDLQAEKTNTIYFQINSRPSNWTAYALNSATLYWGVDDPSTIG